MAQELTRGITASDSDLKSKENIQAFKTTV